ncbi:ABC transporter ATP-binding protein [Rothia nasimurium]|uniref:ABC transporter ATP-binding protein n=1 Tax=Rothia nasimurium TaxID=85336 RepID=UPI001F2C0BFE|nr:ABC transporter ATP-binding protein [Rothia nasimurium]
MLNSIRNLFYLVDFPVKTKLIVSVLGAFIVSLLEIFGVMLTYPLLLVASGQSFDTGILGNIASIAGATSRQELIIVLAVIIVFAFVLKALFTIGFRWWQVGFISRMERSARVNLFSLYLDSSYQEHKKRELSKIHTNLATAISQSYGQTISSFLSFITSILTVILMYAVILVISPEVALFAIALFAGVGYLIPLTLRKSLAKISKEFTEADYLSWFSSMPALSAFREVRLFGVSDNFVAKYDDGSRLRARASRKQSVINELPKNIIEIIFILSIAALATYMFATKSQSEAVATMGAFSVAAVRIMPALNSAIASLNGVRAGSAGVTIIEREISQFRKHRRYSQISSEGIKFNGDILVDSVSFQYSPTNRMILENISIKIPARKTVAFVGSSGSGKSTLVDIILGMLEPTEGRVTCGGHRIDSDIKSWHHQLGVVPQSVYVLPGNLKENVAFGLKPDQIDEERVLAALKYAELAELVESLPQGINEDLGQEGSRLSGGQRQRLGIARALYRTPSLLVLDEATSALDNKTEHKITQTIENLSGEMTILIVAHRLSTIRKADIIYYMKDGKVVGKGNFEELSKTVSEFKELVDLGKL